MQEAVGRKVQADQVGQLVENDRELQVKAQYSDYDEVTAKYGVPLIEKEPEKKLLPSQAKDPVIREALMHSRQADRLVQQYDLGDLSQELAKIQQGKRLAQEIEQGKAAFKADFEQFKAQALQQLKEQQKLEQEQAKLKPFKGIER